MFFTGKLFKEYVRPEDAETIAKLVNGTIDQNGIVLYGNFYGEGKANNFTSERKPGDTHICIGIGMSQMGIFEPLKDSSPQVDKASEDELMKLMTQNSQAARDENNRLREGKE
jgi:hypothetical protein